MQRDNLKTLKHLPYQDKLKVTTAPLEQLNLIQNLQQYTPVTPAGAVETPAADAPIAPAADTDPVEDVRAERASSEATLPKNGVNHAGVLGLALAGFGMLTTGLGAELSASRGKHSKR